MPSLIQSRGGRHGASVVVRPHVRRPETLHVPGVEDLVGGDRGERGREPEVRAVDAEVGARVLQRRASAEARVEDHVDGVLVPWRDVEHVLHGRHHLLDLVPDHVARPARHLALGVGGEAVPFPVDPEAVDVEPPDERRHVDQLVIAVGRELPRRGSRREPRGHAPVVLGVDHDVRAKAQVAALGEQEQVGAVEECEVGLGPRVAVVELIRRVVESDGHPARARGVHAPRVVVLHVPADLRPVLAGPHVAHVPREVVQLVGSGRPSREGEGDLCRVADVERHLDVDDAARGGPGVEGDVVADVGDPAGDGRPRGGGRADRQRQRENRENALLHEPLLPLKRHR